MCGIVGYLSPKKSIKEAKKDFTTLLCLSGERGEDATGLAFALGNKKYLCFKKPIPASKFVVLGQFKEIMSKYNPQVAIGHARQQTQGDAKDNRNNHPIYTETGLMLIHNGIVWNDVEVKKEFNLKTDGEVDSEVIVRLIEYFKQIKGNSTQKAIQLAMKELRGTFACALLDAHEPTVLYLWRSGSPLSMAYNKKTGVFYFASTQEIIEDSTSEASSFFNGLFTKRSTKNFVFKEPVNDLGYRITLKTWDSFIIETKAAYNGSLLDEPRHQKWGYTTTATKPIKVEASPKTKLIVALAEQGKDFDVVKPISNPSTYLSELLFMRLEFIQNVYVMKGTTKADNLDNVALNTEARRIINTLKVRKLTTKRKMYVPTIDEIMKSDPKKVKWVLSDRNGRLAKILEDAEVDYFTQGEEDGRYYPD